MIIIKKNKKAPLDSSKGIDLEVNAERTNKTVKSLFRYQTA